MQDMAESVLHLAHQLDRLKEVPNSEELCRTISEFSKIIEEVVDFIHNWLGSWLGAYPSARDGISTQSLVQSISYLLSLRRTELSSYGRKWVDLENSLL